MALVKCNFMLNDEVKEWYKVEGEKMGLSMSGLMSFVLAQYKKNEESRQVLAELNQANKSVDYSILGDLLKLVQDTKDDVEENSYVEIRDMLNNTEKRI